MSFGGGRDSYTLEYIIKVTNQGGTGGFSQINSGLTQVNTNVNKVAMSQEKLNMIQDKVTASNQKVIQAQQGVTKGMKGLAFGILGVTTAGAEFVGMMSMWRQTSTAVAEAQKEVDTALKESGKNSKDYKDAVDKLAKANRWARMTFRNLMLSMFDMVPFFILTINGIVKLRTAYKTLREAQLEQQAMQDVLKRSNIGLAESNLLANTSYAKLSKAQRIAKAEQALMISSNELLAASNAQVTATTLTANGAISTLPVALGKTEKSMGLLGRTGAKLNGMFAGVGAAVSGFLGKILKIAAPIAAIIIAVEAWKNNWGGFGDIVNQVGVKIGNIHPILKTTMEVFAKIGNSIDRLVHGDFTGVKEIWVSGSKEMGDATTEMSEKQQKALEELREKILDLNSAAMDTFGDAAMGDKGERKDFLKSMGLDKGARKMIGGVLDDFKKIEKGALGLHNALDTMRTLNLMQKFGIDVPNKAWKEIAAGLADVFKDIGKSIPGDDMFDQFAEVMEKTSKKKGPVVVKAIMAFMDDNPNFLPFLTAHSPELAAAITTMLNEASAEANKKIGGANGFMGAILGTGKSETTNKWFGTPGSSGAVDLGGDKGASMFQPIIDGIAQGMKDLKTALDGADWGPIGAAIRTGIETGISAQNFTKAVAFLRMNLLDPLAGLARSVGGIVVDELRAGMKERNTSGNPLTDAMNQDALAQTDSAEFLSQLFFGMSKEDMKGTVDNFFTNTIPMAFRAAWTNAQYEVQKSLEGNPLLGTLTDIGLFLLGDLSAGNKLISGFTTWVVDNIIIPIVEEWNKMISTMGSLFTAPVEVQPINLGDIISDILPSIFGDINTLVTKATKWIQDNIILPIVNAFGDTVDLIVSGINFIFSGVNEIAGGGGSSDKPLLDRIWDSVVSALGIQTAAGATGGNTITASITIDKIDVSKLISDSSTAGSKIIGIFQSMATEIGATFINVLTAWAETTNGIIEMAQASSEGVIEELSGMMDDSFSIFEGIAEGWSETANSIGANSESANEQTIDAFSDMMDDSFSIFEGIAEGWGEVCKALVSDAESAADDINSALDSIEDEEVIIRYRTVGSPKAKGGLMSFAGGGVMSAAGGKLLTTYGPQMFQIGDNPGGRESVWAIPHNNPGPTVAKIDRMYKPSSGGSGGVTVLNGNFNFVIPGDGIINNVKLNKRIKMTVGENRDRFGF